MTLTDGPNKGDSVYDPDYRPLVYAKDIKSTVLRNHPVLRMSYREPDEKLPEVPRASVWGNVKSDVTSGNEGVYKRSYY